MKHASSVTKGFSGYPCCNSTTSKWYLIYVPSTCKTVSSYGVVCEEKNSIVLSYKSRLYSEALAILPTVVYITYATSSHEQTGDIITFEQFEEGNLVENERST